MLKKIIIYIFILFLMFSCIAGPSTTKTIPKSKAEGKNLIKHIKTFKACSLEKLGISPTFGEPTTIQGAIDLINLLPKPLSIPCFISSLNRPLNVFISNSQLSAQPAFGNENPRIFIMNLPLIISISTYGVGSHLLEFAEITENSRSIKGELLFPITENIMASTSFDRINMGERTSCSGCHRFEQRTNTNYSGFVYESLILKPTDSSMIEIEEFKQEADFCLEAKSLTHRCQIIFSIFNQSLVQHRDFPIGSSTFLGSFSL